MLDHALLDVATALAEATSDVGDGLLAHSIVENLAEESARLLVVVVGMCVRIAAGGANHSLFSPGVDRALDGCASDRVGLVVRLRAVVTVDSHEAVAGVVVTHASAVGAVDWDLIVVGAEAMTVGVGIVDKAALEHFIVARLNAGNHMGRGEGSLFCLSVEILRVLVQHELADLLEGVVTVRPDLSDIVDIKAVVIGVSDRHNLGVPGPRGEVTLLNLVEEVVGGPVLVLLAHLSGFLSGEVVDTLVGLVVVLDEELGTGGIDPLEGMGAVAVHLAVAIGGAAVRHQDSDLVKSLGGVGPEVEGHVRVLDAGLGMAFLAVDEVRELHGVLDEEDRGVVADHVVVSLLSVMLDGKAARITIAVVSTALTSDSGEAEEDRRPLSNGVHEGSLAETKGKDKRVSQ